MEVKEKRELTIGQMVARDYRKAELFTKYGLDFCCGGKITVEQACKEKSIDPTPLLAELQLLDQDADAAQADFANVPLDELVDHIISTHHEYVRENIPIISGYTQKVARVHGDRLPEVRKIAVYFQEVCEELTAHMYKEEMILFPYIKKLAIADKMGTPLAPAPFGSIQNPIDMMEAEHDRAGNIFDLIRSLTNDLTAPKGACMTHLVSYHKLKEFEADLHRHIHLENNILFTRAIDLEAKLFN